MSKEMKITVVQPDEVEYWDDELQEFVFNPRAKYYVIDSLGQYHFISTRDRLAAQRWSDEYFGKNKYVVRVAKEGKGSGNYTVSGSNSRKGFSPQLKKTY